MPDCQKLFHCVCKGKTVLRSSIYLLPTRLLYRLIASAGAGGGNTNLFGCTPSLPESETRKKKWSVPFVFFLVKPCHRATAKPGIAQSHPPKSEHNESTPLSKVGNTSLPTLL